MDTNILCRTVKSRDRRKWPRLARYVYLNPPSIAVSISYLSWLSQHRFALAHFDSYGLLVEPCEGVSKPGRAKEEKSLHVISYNRSRFDCLRIFSRKRGRLKHRVWAEMWTGFDCSVENGEGPENPAVILPSTVLLVDLSVLTQCLAICTVLTQR